MVGGHDPFDGRLQAAQAETVMPTLSLCNACYIQEALTERKKKKKKSLKIYIFVVNYGS
jgi:hypothetical protein